MKLAVLFTSMFLIGCASTPFPHDTGPGAAAGTMVGGYAGYVLVESISSAHPFLSILGAVGGAAVGRSIGTSIDNEDDAQ